jgi:thiol-disulfide isomerase/thioredoxin
MRIFKTFSAVLFLSVTASLFAVNHAVAQTKKTWLHDFKQAEREAKKANLPLIVHFHASWCGPCRQIERAVLSRPQFLSQLGTKFVGVKIDSDRHPDVVRRFRVKSLPTDLFLDPNGRILARTEGYQDSRSYFGRMARIDAQFAQARKVLVAKSGSPKGEPAKLQPDDDPGSLMPVAGLNGYSPVALWHGRKWTKGKTEFSVAHKGITFQMSTREEFDKFLANPQRYAPRLLGCDPVKLYDSDRAVAGSTKFGAYFEDELYLFVDKASRTKFKTSPYRYTTTRHVLRADRIYRTAAK